MTSGQILKVIEHFGETPLWEIAYQLAVANEREAAAQVGAQINATHGIPDPNKPHPYVESVLFRYIAPFCSICGFKRLHDMHIPEASNAKPTEAEPPAGAKET
jgi:hypothetical protein